MSKLTHFNLKGLPEKSIFDWNPGKQSKLHGYLEREYSRYEKQSVQRPWCVSGIERNICNYCYSPQADAHENGSYLDLFLMAEPGTWPRILWPQRSPASCYVVSFLSYNPQDPICTGLWLFTHCSFFITHVSTGSPCVSNHVISMATLALTGRGLWHFISH